MDTQSIVIKGGALLIAGILGGCGGGGGGNAGFALPLAPEGSGENAVAPAASTAPPSEVPAEEKPPSELASAPSEEPAPDETNPLACIAKPQTGSTAAVGNAYEGLWSQSNGNNVPSGKMQVDPAGNLQGFTAAASLSATSDSDQFYGTSIFDVANNVWQLNAGKGTPWSLMNWQVMSGSGTFAARSTINGHYSLNDGPQKAFGPWVYDKANSLAVSPSLLEGDWGGMYALIVGTITVSGDGSFVGSSPTSSLYGTCKLSGTIRPSEAGTKKNSLALSLQATDAAQGDDKPCALVGVTSGVGHVAVDQDEAQPVCTRSMTLYFFLDDPVTGKPSGGTFAFGK